MIGLQFIADTFHMEYKTVAEKIGVSKQTFQDWIKGRRKIPQPRLERLSELFGIKETELFQRELADSEKTDIQILYFQNTDVVEEIEVPQFDDNGKEHSVKYSVSQNKGIIDYLSERSEEDKLIEGVTEAISSDEGKENKELIKQLLSVLDGTQSQRKTIELVLYALSEYGRDEWSGIRPQFIKFHEQGFFDKFSDLLKEFGLSDE